MSSQIQLECPCCGAELSVDDNRDYTFCTYCGRRIPIEHSVKTAEIIRAETERETAAMQLELKKKKMDEDLAHKKNVLKAKIIWGISSVVIMILGILLANASNDPDSDFYFLVFIGFFSALGCGFSFLMPVLLKLSDQDGAQDSSSTRNIVITSSLENWEGKSYSTVYALFKSTGFNKIQTNPLCDLKWGTGRKNGIVSSVLINGEEEWEEGDEFPADATVLILYHSVK